MRREKMICKRHYLCFAMAFDVLKIEAFMDLGCELTKAENGC
jgi:hypothetical protein